MRVFSPSLMIFGGHGNNPSRYPFRSYPNINVSNWVFHVEKLVGVSFRGRRVAVFMLIMSPTRETEYVVLGGFVVLVEDSGD